MADNSYRPYGLSSFYDPEEDGIENPIYDDKNKNYQYGMFMNNLHGQKRYGSYSDDDQDINIDNNNNLADELGLLVGGQLLPYALSGVKQGWNKFQNWRQQRRLADLAREVRNNINADLLNKNNMGQGNADIFNQTRLKRANSLPVNRFHAVGEDALFSPRNLVKQHSLPVGLSRIDQNSLLESPVLSGRNSHLNTAHSAEFSFPRVGLSNLNPLAESDISSSANFFPVNNVKAKPTNFFQNLAKKLFHKQENQTFHTRKQPYLNYNKIVSEASDNFLDLVPKNNRYAGSQNNYLNSIDDVNPLSTRNINDLSSNSSNNSLLTKEHFLPQKASTSNLNTISPDNIYFHLLQGKSPSSKIDSSDFSSLQKSAKPNFTDNENLRDLFYNNEPYNSSLQKKFLNKQPNVKNIFGQEVSNDFLDNFNNNQNNYFNNNSNQNNFYKDVNLDGMNGYIIEEYNNPIKNNDAFPSTSQNNLNKLWDDSLDLDKIKNYDPNADYINELNNQLGNYNTQTNSLSKVARSQDIPNTNIRHNNYVNTSRSNLGDGPNFNNQNVFNNKVAPDDFYHSPTNDVLASFTSDGSSNNNGYMLKGRENPFPPQYNSLNNGLDKLNQNRLLNNNFVNSSANNSLVNTSPLKTLAMQNVEETTNLMRQGTLNGVQGLGSVRGAGSLGNLGAIGNYKGLSNVGRFGSGSVSSPLRGGFNLTSGLGSLAGFLAPLALNFVQSFSKKRDGGYIHPRRSYDSGGYASNGLGSTGVLTSPQLNDDSQDSQSNYGSDKNFGNVLINDDMVSKSPKYSYDVEKEDFSLPAFPYTMNKEQREALIAQNKPKIEAGEYVEGYGKTGYGDMSLNGKTIYENSIAPKKKPFNFGEYIAGSMEHPERLLVWLKKGGYIHPNHHYDGGGFVRPDYESTGLGSISGMFPSQTLKSVATGQEGGFENVNLNQLQNSTGNTGLGDFNPSQNDINSVNQVTPMYDEKQANSSLYGGFSGTQTFGLGGIATNFGTSKRRY